MKDNFGDKDAAVPSTAVQMSGLHVVPIAGDDFVVAKTLDEVCCCSYCCIAAAIALSDFMDIMMLACSEVLVCRLANMALSCGVSRTGPGRETCIAAMLLCFKWQLWFAR